MTKGGTNQILQKAGLTDRQVALHLWSRFTFGAKPIDIDERLKIGGDKWFSQQLPAKFKNAVLDSRLSGYDV